MVGRCPRLEAGPGRVVLTTVNHLNSFVLDLTVRDAASGKLESLGVTGWHKFYDEADGWQSACELTTGDTLRGFAGGQVTVVGATRRSAPERVYNFTVEADHVYYVGDLSTLTHNVKCYKDPEQPGYNNGAGHMDHSRAGALGGTNDPSNLRPLPAESNMRKGGYEGQLKKDRDEYEAQGLTREQANEVIEPEIQAMMNSPTARPTDPDVLDTLPAR